MDQLNPYAVAATVVLLLLAWAVAAAVFAWLFGAVAGRRNVQRPRYRRAAR